MYNTCSVRLVRSSVVNLRASINQSHMNTRKYRYDTHIENSLKEIHDGIGEDDDETTVRTIMVCDNLVTHDGKRKMYPCFGENPLRLVGFVDGKKYIQKSTAPFKFESKDETELLNMYKCEEYRLLKSEGYKSFQSMLDDLPTTRIRADSFVDNFEEEFLPPIDMGFSFARSGSSGNNSTQNTLSNDGFLR